MADSVPPSLSLDIPVTTAPGTFVPSPAQGSCGQGLPGQGQPLPRSLGNGAGRPGRVNTLCYLSFESSDGPAAHVVRIW